MTKKAYIRQTRPPIFYNAGFCQQHEDFIHVTVIHYNTKIFKKKFKLLLIYVFNTKLMDNLRITNTLINIR